MAARKLITPRLLIRKFISCVRLNPDTNCWEWVNGNSCQGYGILQFGRKKYPGSFCERATRFSYRIFNGPISKDQMVCHRCDNPKCVNPRHLFAGTQKDNMTDCASKKRTAYGERGGQSKIKEGDVREIFKLKASGLSYLKIGRMYGLDFSTIYSIIKRKSWKYVEIQ